MRDLVMLVALLGFLVFAAAVGFLLLGIMALSARLMRWRFGEDPPDATHAEYGSHQSGEYVPVSDDSKGRLSGFMSFASSTVRIPVLFFIVNVLIMLLIVFLIKPMWLLK